MPGRPALPVGSHGTIRVRPYRWDEAGQPTAYRAISYYRDTDGISRRVSKVAQTPAAAKRGLQADLTDRDGAPGKGGVTGNSRLRDLAPMWLESIQRQVDSDNLAPGTARLYGISVNVHILPLMGGLTLREANDVTRCNDALISIADNVGAPTAKTARAALSGMFGYAIRLGLIAPPNPVRECAPISAKPKRSPRSFTEEERKDWLAKVDADDAARRRDIPDLTRMFLATGCRIAEVLAVTFDDIDLTTGEVAIDWQITYIKGRGLVRRRTKSKAGERTLVVPSWAVSMLRRRKLLYGYGPVFPHHKARKNPDMDRSEAWRDPSNTSKAFREARAKAGYEWFTSHVLRKTVATDMDDAGMSAREVANQLGQSRVSIAQDVYMSRKSVGSRAAEALEAHDPDQPAE
jgi:integrase